MDEAAFLTAELPDWSSCFLEGAEEVMVKTSIQLFLSIPIVLVVFYCICLVSSLIDGNFCSAIMCACARACPRACARACPRACARACVCARAREPACGCLSSLVLSWSYVRGPRFQLS